MSGRDVEDMIEDYMKRTRKVLPKGRETEDLLDDLRTHILDSLADKSEQRPGVSQSDLIEEVLEELGNPEQIAREFESTHPEEPARRRRKTIRLVARLVFAVAVVVVAAVVVSSIPLGQHEAPPVDFVTALIVLMVFAVAEWYVRAWQTKSAD